MAGEEGLERADHPASSTARLGFTRESRRQFLRAGAHEFVIQNSES
jgi:hypothetical protein